MQFPGSDLYWGSLSEIYRLTNCSLTCFFEVASMVEFLSSEAGANRLSAEKLLQAAAKTFQEGL